MKSERDDAMSQLLNPNQKYTFRDIFNLRAEVDELAAELGYSLKRETLHLPRYQGNLERTEETRSRIVELLPYVNLANEQTRREVLISPIAADLVHYTHAQLRIEYPIKVTDQLQGTLDYYLRRQAQLLVIEAKQEDLTNGFTQLAVEMIALDQWEKTPGMDVQPYIVGAITTGTLWQLGVLHRHSRLISQGLNSYRIPEDIDPLTRILVQALMEAKTGTQEQG
jgi:hypothetical protein